MQVRVTPLNTHTNSRETTHQPPLHPNSPHSDKYDLAAAPEIPARIKSQMRLAVPATQKKHLISPKKVSVNPKLLNFDEFARYSPIEQATFV